MKKKLDKIASVLLLLFVLLMMLGGCGEKKVESKYTCLKLDDYIAIPNDYLEFQFDKPTGIEVSEKEIDSAIDIALQGAAVETEEREGLTKLGDKIYISYIAESSDGKILTKNEGYYVTLGKEYLKTELQDALLGRAVGDVITVKSLISDDFVADETLRGMDVTYKVTIEKKFNVIIPELDDTFIKNNSTANSIEEYREQIKRQIYDVKYNDAVYEKFNQKWDEIVEQSKVKEYPEGSLDEEIEFFNGYVNYSGYSSSDLDLEQLGQEYAEDAVKQKLVLYKISTDNDLIPTEKEFQKYATDKIATKNYDEESFKKTFIYSSYEYGIKYGWLEEYLEEQIEKLFINL